MNKKNIIFLLLFFKVIFCCSQKVKQLKTEIGFSAVSTKTLYSKTYSFEYPIYALDIDTINDKLFFTIRRKNPNGKQNSKLGSLAVLNYNNDSLNWNVNVTQFDITILNNYLLLSNDLKTSRYNNNLGYEQFQYPGKIIHAIQNNSGLMYLPQVNDELKCVQLSDGAIKWQCKLPSENNWNDFKKLNDTTFIVASNGLSAINLNYGKIWEHILVTNDAALKTFTYSNINANNLNTLNNLIITSSNESQITGLSSNILIDTAGLFYAAKNKLIAVDFFGKIKWEYDLSKLNCGQMILNKNSNTISLLNLGIASYNENKVIYGKPFLLKFDKETGVLIDNKVNTLDGLTDFFWFKNDWIFANKKNIYQTTISNSNLQNIIDVGENKFGKFSEFIDGNQYYVEKEGFYVPLNFINDNVVYFRTENDKVYGVSNNLIEYEYHFSELFKLRATTSNKKVLTQRYKSIVVNKNFELLATYKTNGNVITLKDKIYFTDENSLFIVNLNDL